MTHIYTEMSQGNSLRSYLKQTKMPFYFSFTKSQNRRAEQSYLGGRVPVGKRRRWKKGTDGAHSANAVHTGT
jgi:hypothetical protein